MAGIISGCFSRSSTVWQGACSACWRCWSALTCPRTCSTWSCATRTKVLRRHGGWRSGLALPGRGNGAASKSAGRPPCRDPALDHDPSVVAFGKGWSWLGGRDSGSVFARCGCRDGHGGRRGASCPRLGEAGHGSWYFSIDLPRPVDGGRRRLRRGGYLTCEAAASARERLSVPARGGPGEGMYTVGQWLDAWVETRARLRDSTRRIYRSHARQHLRRVFDGVLLRELDPIRVGQAFARLSAGGMSAATARRVFSTCGRR